MYMVCESIFYKFMKAMEKKKPKSFFLYLGVADGGRY